jgi:hypothetical protein
LATLEIMGRTSAPVQYDPIRYEQQLISGKWIECRGHPLPGGGSLAIYRDINESKHLYRAALIGTHAGLCKLGDF